MNINNLVSSLMQNENLGKKIIEIFDSQAETPKTIDQKIQSIHDQIFLEAENILKLQPERQLEVKELENDWKKLHLYAEKNITTEFQENLVMFAQKAQNLKFSRRCRRKCEE